jgi:hypothetical protein
MAHRRLWWMLAEAASRANPAGWPPASRAHRTSPRAVCKLRTNSVARRIVGHIRRPRDSSPVTST